MIEKGFCQCGCGQKTTIPQRTDRLKNQIKGNPMRFIRGHISKIKHPMWKGGRIFNGDYWKIHMPKHPRANINGYVSEHILVAEKAIKKSLPPKTEIHHFPNRKEFTHIVICQDSQYHNLLDRRYRAFRICSHANWRKCTFCKQYDSVNNLKIAKYGQVFHIFCRRKYRLSSIWHKN